MPQPKHRHDAAHVGLVPPGQLGTGAPDGTKYLRDDNTWQPATAMGLIASAGGGAAGTRIWVGTTDPGGAASEGDIWIRA
jgi:hypothetical protein